MRCLLVTLTALLTLASPAFASGVADVTVSNAVPTNATGARTVYVVGLKTSAAGALGANDRIRVTFPAATGFGGYAGGVVRDVAASEDKGNCSNPNNGVIECALYSGRTIAGNREVRITFNGLTNAGASDQHRVTVSTTTDADPVNSPFFTVVAAGQLSQITLANAVPSAAAGARTNYVLQFKTSATGGMSSQANSRFDITFPPLTGYAGWAGGVVHDVTRGVDIGNCSNPSLGAIACSLYSGQFVNAGDTVRITLSGITNPTDPGTDKLVRASTTSDWALLPSDPFSVVAANPVGAVTLSNADPSNAAGARTRYVAAFTTSATGGLSQAANSRIDVTFPTGTGFSGYAGATVRDVTRGVDVGNCSNPNASTIQCALFSGRFVNAGDAVRITFHGITNAPAGADKTVSVTTTSDPAAVNSAPFSVVLAGALTGVTVANGAPSAAASARTRYLVGLTTSATGGLSEDANSRISVTFPAGTSFSHWAGATVSAGGVAVGNCSNPVELTIQCGLFSGRAIAAGAAVTIAFDGITNPPTTGTGKTVAVSTTSDPASVSSAPFSVVAGGTLSGVSVAVGSLAPVAKTDYVVRSTLSSTGGIAQEANSRIDVTFPAGTTFAGWGGGSVHDVTRGVTVGNCASPNGLNVQCALFSGRTVAAGALLQVTFVGVTNPASAGPHRLTMSTTSDTPAVSSSNYTQGEAQPPAAPDLTGTSGTTDAPAAEFTFASALPGITFECSFDDAPFSACTSPMTYTGLAAGAHTFRVRAVDAAGLAGAPSARTFTVAAPQEPTPAPTPVPTASPVPTATPTPAPPPTPEFREDVVVAPVSGMIKVCPKGPGGACTPLPAGATIPMGTTVDARRGVVELTSLSAPGAPPQKARFSEGMFVVEQVGAITQLTLNEPLDCRKLARTSQSKPKSRRLWGDGKGKFRTKGRYSAATIRGTKWLVQDTCTTTLTRVTQGVVSVRDAVKRKTVTVRAGKRYTARARA